MNREEMLTNAWKTVREAERNLITRPVSTETKMAFMDAWDALEALKRGEIPEGMQKVVCPGCGGESYVPAHGVGKLFCTGCGTASGEPG